MPRQMNQSLDTYIRNSIVGRNLSRLRSSPKLYGLLRTTYSRLFQAHSRHDLAPYQSKAVHRFVKLVPRELMQFGVLEIGSDVDAKVIRELHALGATRVIGINPVFTDDDLNKFNPLMPQGCSLARGDMRNTGIPSDSVGAVFSVAVFEHLLDFDKCLLEMHRILVSGGMVYAHFGPIWSSSLGHHVYANVGEQKARHWDPSLNPLDDHSHLLLSRQEMGLSIADRVPARLGEEILKWVYESNDINRLFYDDYVRMFEQSPFEIVHLSPEREHLPEKTKSALNQHHGPTHHTFDVRNAEVLLRKR
jgi:hypothetical protein